MCRAFGYWISLEEICVEEYTPQNDTLQINRKGKCPLEKQGLPLLYFMAEELLFSLHYIRLHINMTHIFRIT